MFYQNRFTERARQALTLAQEAAASVRPQLHRLGAPAARPGCVRAGGPAAKALTAAA